MSDQVHPVVLPDGRAYFNLAELAHVMLRGTLGTEGFTGEELKTFAVFLISLDQLAAARTR